MTRLPTTSSQPRPAAWSADDLGGNPHAAPDKAARVQQMFAAIARRYDLNNRLHSLGRDQAWRRRAVELCEVKPTDDVLDVACGTGDLTLAFADAGPRSVTGLDFTKEMLQIAREKTARRRFTQSKIQNPKSKIPIPVYLQADAMHLPFPDASFDIVSIAFGIRNVADPAQALREFRRVLRAGVVNVAEKVAEVGGGEVGGREVGDVGGGRLVVLEFSQPRHPILRWLNHIYTARLMPITATLIARDRSGAYRYLPKSVATFAETDQFAQLLAACGFARPQIHPLTFGVCTAYVAQIDPAL